MNWDIFFQVGQIAGILAFIWLVMQALIRR